MKETANEQTTLCDYDSACPFDLWYRVQSLRRECHNGVEWIRRDKTARGYHVVIRWRKPWKLAEIVAVQAILGSDPIREVHNLMRARTNPRRAEEKQYWNILYRRKHRLPV